jgi:hypothetical protein
MATDRLRTLEIDGPGLDAQAIILGARWDHVEPALPSSESVSSAVAWEGMVQGDGTGPQSSYFVRLYVDGTATCQCPAFYFRATLRRNPEFCCKHIRRARVRQLGGKRDS